MLFVNSLLPEPSGRLAIHAENISSFVARHQALAEPFHHLNICKANGFVQMQAIVGKKQIGGEKGCAFIAIDKGMVACDPL